MASLKTPSLLTLATLAVQVAAHGHVDWIITDGIAYRGYDAPAFNWNPTQFPVAGWITGATDNGYVEPNSFSDPDIICHRAARNARGHITVSAGDKINLKWNDWPSSHKGPVIDYLAKCPGNCQDADKSDLEFFKIGEEGLIDLSKDNGHWASDVLISNGNSWTLQIPSELASGNYVLRHEIIALHGAGQRNGAQNYPQCFNIKVTGGGSVLPEGIKGTELYESSFINRAKEVRGQYDIFCNNPKRTDHVFVVVFIIFIVFVVLDLNDNVRVLQLDIFSKLN
ncbi:endoglucanase [Fusarium sporotrichioides]|uniref:lytic cellulose monooxygenase (C4-dehydrogenating) n=1 Tax=Fusarium sporotrichioides TaxID=5514 RepID=A0A395SQ84_FUSSP|nr:endoglucanase [Fusarium sporotrichioides]